LRRGVIRGTIGDQLQIALKDYHPAPGQPSAEEVLHSFRRRVQAIPPPPRVQPNFNKPIDYPSVFIQEQRRHADLKKRRKTKATNSYLK
jgi:hypothetical protein